MNLRHATMVVLLVGLIAAVPAMAQNGPRPARVAVVNMGKVFNSMQETKDIKAKLEADQTSLKTLTDQHQADLANLQQMIRNGPKPDTQQYDDMVSQYDQKRVTYETDLQMKKLSLARSQTRQLKVIFDKIQGVVGDVAKEKGFDLVITEVHPELPPDAQDLNPDALAQMINQRNVMFVAPDYDLTSDVITALDAKYKSGGK